jgi:hypothetical protein
MYVYLLNQFITNHILMINKCNTISEEKNSVVTPEAVEEALDNLPYGYVIETLALLNKWKSEGKIKSTYSKVYISRVRTGDKGAFNKDIMNALVEVGTKNKAEKEQYGRITKKASPSN